MCISFLFILVFCASAFSFQTQQHFIANRPPFAGSTTAMASNLKDDDLKPKRLEAFSQGFQVWALRYPKWNPLAKFVPVFRLLERIQIARSTAHEFFYHKRLVFGDNFCCQGCVWISDFEQVEKALTSPQARTTNLGAMPMDVNRLPDKTNKGRMTFLLALSDQEAGGNGDREGFRAALDDYIFETESVKQRQTDATAKALLQDLVKDYKEMGHSKEFFEDPRRGLHGFLMKNLHYVVFNLDPSDEEIIETLNKFHYDGQSAAYYLKGFNKLLDKVNKNNMPKQAKDVAKIYVESPVISKFVESNPKYHDFTRNEMAYAIKAIMSIAALVGPKTLALNAMGYDPFPAYEGTQTPEIDVTKIWDKLDLENRQDVAHYLYECGRLKLPVATTHRVATEKFTVPIRGKNRTFPKGTKIIVPMSLSMVDKKFWGRTAFEFDHNRENLCPFSMMFNSVGDRDAGRICPGREIAMNVLTDILVELGKVRRSSSFKKVQQ